MRRHPTRNENGFTMIEVIVSLLLIGIMAVLAGMGLVAITQGYVFSQQNNETSLKAQVALAKMVKEIGSLRIETDTITATTATSISYTYTDIVTETTASHTIAQPAGQAQIQFDGITLVDNVNSFTFTYFDAAGAVTTTLADIRRVDIALSMQGAEGIISNFADSAKIQESYY